MEALQNKMARGAPTVRWTLIATLVLCGTARGAEKMDSTKPDSTKPAKPVTKADAAKPDKAAIKASADAIQAAVVALKKEVQAHNGSDKTPFREKCDYFIQNAPKDPILPEAIVQAIGVTYSPDAPSDSYIKWQLLSGAPREFEGDLAHLASVAYMKAAKPLPRPGLSVADKKQLGPMVNGIKTAEEATAVTKKLTDLVDAWEKRDEPVIMYRDELFARLPKNAEAYVARLQDDAQRVEAGYESEKEMKATTDAITKWIDTNPPAAHMQIMADQVKAWWNYGKPKTAGTGAAAGGKGYGGKYGGMYNTAATDTQQFPPKYYQDIEFDSKTNKWQWADRGARQIRKETLDDLVVTLEDAAKNAQKAEKDMAKK